MARPRSFDRKIAIEQAMYCFWQYGYTATSMRHLESAMQLTPSSIYNSFTSKDGLFLAVLDHYITLVIERRVQHYLLNDSCLEQAEYQGAIQGILRFFETCFTALNEEQNKGCLVVNTSIELIANNHLVREKIHNAMKMVNKGIYVALIQAQAEGSLSQTIDTKQRAQTLGLILNGMLVHARLTPDTHWIKQSMDSVKDLLK